MSGPIDLREDFTAETLRRMATGVKDANQARRLLALAAVYEGMSREDAARVGGMDRQTLRDWVHRFNRRGVDGLIDIKAPGRRSKLSAEQREELRQLVEAGPISTRMAWYVGDVWISSGFLANVSALICRK